MCDCTKIEEEQDERNQRIQMEHTMTMKTDIKKRYVRNKGKGATQLGNI